MSNDGPGASLDDYDGLGDMLSFRTDDFAHRMGAYWQDDGPAVKRSRIVKLIGVCKLLGLGLSLGGASDVEKVTGPACT